MEWDIMTTYRLKGGGFHFGRDGYCPPDSKWMWQMEEKGIGSLPVGFNEWTELPCQRAEWLQITWQASARIITKRA